MKKILILGAGTAGTMMANKLRKALNPADWSITVIDPDESHYYQPGFLFIPFGTYAADDVKKSGSSFFSPGIKRIFSRIDTIDAPKNKAYLSDGTVMDYDFLVIATGAVIKPEETTGMKSLWHREIFEFYSFEGALALHDFFRKWQGGRLVMAITEIPFKCPVAPIEFVCLAEAFFAKRRMRDKVQISFVTPLSGAFTKPVATQMLHDMLAAKGIEIVPDFYIERVDPEQKKLISYDEKEVPFDVLVVVPVHKGADYIGKSGLGDDMNFVPVNKHTLQHEKFGNVFALGDAAALPTSKAGSVAHFAADVMVENMVNAMEGKPVSAKFDGHSNCFIETGYGKGVLIDFNYQTEPLPGTFPIPWFGPFSLLKDSRMNHMGKLAFRWIYWNILLKGRHLPISSEMQMTGKRKITEAI